MQVEWYFDGKPIYNMEDVSISRFGRKSSIINIESVQAEHRGKYTCKAINWAGSAYFTAELEVNGDWVCYFHVLLCFRF